MLKKIISNNIVKNITLRNYSKFTKPSKDLNDDLLLEWYKKKQEPTILNSTTIEKELKIENDSIIEYDDEYIIPKDEYNDRED